MHNQPDFNDRILNVAQGGNDTVFQRHSEECSDCQEELATVKQLLRFHEVTGGALATVSEQQVNQLSSLLKRVRPDLGRIQSTGPTLVGRIKTIWAELLQDTGGQLQLVGLRSGGSPDTRQIAFVSDVADLDLEVTSANDQQMVNGQVGMDELPKGMTIRFVPASEDPLQVDEADTISGDIDELGYFKVQIQSGKWVAFLRLDDVVVLFPEVQL